MNNNIINKIYPTALISLPEYHETVELAKEIKEFFRDAGERKLTDLHREFIQNFPDLVEYQSFNFIWGWSYRNPQVASEKYNIMSISNLPTPWRYSEVADKMCVDIEQKDKIIKTMSGSCFLSVAFFEEIETAYTKEQIEKLVDLLKRYTEKYNTCTFKIWKLAEYLNKFDRVSQLKEQAPVIYNTFYASK